MGGKNLCPAQAQGKSGGRISLFFLSSRLMSDGMETSRMNGERAERRESLFGEPDLERIRMFKSPIRYTLRNTWRIGLRAKVIPLKESWCEICFILGCEIMEVNK